MISAINEKNIYRRPDDTIRAYNIISYFSYLFIFVSDFLKRSSYSLICTDQSAYLKQTN